MHPIGRKALPHEPPLSIGTAGVIFFLTICAVDREERPLVKQGVPELLLEAVRHGHEKGSWYVRLILVMPDHVHALIRVPIEGSLKRVVQDWKRWTATKGEFTWQRDFFDHRLRTEKSEREKADYVLLNPVRAGLVSRAEDWPYVWMPRE